MDITKCGGQKCIIKDHCKRYTVLADGKWQSHFHKPPFKIKNKLFQCEFFMGDRSLFLLEQLKGIMNGNTD